MQDIQLSQIDLNLLVSLEILLRVRSVSVAARNLRLSQSAMSHQLRRLRETFDDPILVACKGGMVPTPFAQSMEAPVRRALSELGRAIRADRGFDPATSTRTFVIATQDVVESLGLPLLLDFIAKEAPGIRATARPITASTARELEEGTVDIALGPDLEAAYNVPHPELRKTVIDTDALMCIVRAGHPLEQPGEQPMDLETFLELRHVAVSAHESHESAIDNALETLGHQRDVAATVSHYLSAMFIVASSDVVATIPGRLACAFADFGRVRAIHMPRQLDIAPSPFVMTWHQRSESDPAVSWLREVTVKLAALSHPCTGEVP